LPTQCIKTTKIEKRKGNSFRFAGSSTLTEYFTNRASQNGQPYYPQSAKQAANPPQATVQTYTQTMSHQKGGHEMLGFTPDGGFLAIGMEDNAWSSGTVSFSKSTSYGTGPAMSSPQPVNHNKYRTIGRQMPPAMPNISCSQYSQGLFRPSTESWKSPHATSQTMIGFPGPPPSYYANNDSDTRVLRNRNV
jgi:hypothetical protein